MNTCKLCHKPVQPETKLRYLTDDGFCNCAMSYAMGAAECKETCYWCGERFGARNAYYADGEKFCSSECQLDFSIHEARAMLADELAGRI